MITIPLIKISDIYQTVASQYYDAPPPKYVTLIEQDGKVVYSLHD